MAAPVRIALTRAVLETKPSTRTSRGYWVQEVDSNHRPFGYEPNELPLLHPATNWCPSAEVRRVLPLGRRPCIYQHLSGVDRKGVAPSTRFLRRSIASNGTCRPKNGGDGGPRTRDLLFAKQLLYLAELRPRIRKMDDGSGIAPLETLVCGQPDSSSFLAVENLVEPQGVAP